MKSICCIHFLFLYLSFWTDLFAKSPKADGWLAFGDIRGNFESCGCDPATDLGGVSRLARFLHQEKSENKNILIFDLGNNLSPSGENPLKDEYLERAIEQLPVDATLLNYIEAKNPWSELRQRSFVLSNQQSRKKPSVYPVSDYLKKKGYIIFAYLWHPDLSSELDSWRNGVPEIVMQHRKSEKDMESLLLFSGPEDHLETLVRSRLFDVIICSDSQSDLSQSGNREGINSENFDRFIDGSPVHIVPQRGTGVLRGGALRKKKADDFQGLISAAEMTSSGTSQKWPPLSVLKTNVTFPELLQDFPVTWLDQKWKGSSPLTDLMISYRKAVTMQFKKRSDTRQKELTHSPYGGAISCQSCHQREWNIWSGSRHAHALNTLKQRERSEDPDCVRCHVLGWAEPGGYVSWMKTPDFAGVQCENCHGAAKKHSQNPLNNKPFVSKPSADVCTGCHHSPHTGKFSFSHYWNKIRH